MATSVRERDEEEFLEEDEEELICHSVRECLSTFNVKLPPELVDWWEEEAYVDTEALSMYGKLWLVFEHGHWWDGFEGYITNDEELFEFWSNMIWKLREALENYLFKGYTKDYDLDYLVLKESWDAGDGNKLHLLDFKVRDKTGELVFKGYVEGVMELVKEKSTPDKPYYRFDVYRVELTLPESREP